MYDCKCILIFRCTQALNLKGYIVRNRIRDNLIKQTQISFKESYEDENDQLLKLQDLSTHGLNNNAFNPVAQGLIQNKCL